VLIPEDNAKDLTEISDAIKGRDGHHPGGPARRCPSPRRWCGPPVPIVWEEDTKVPVKPDTGDEAPGGLTAH